LSNTASCGAGVVLFGFATAMRGSGLVSAISVVSWHVDGSRTSLLD
jgi:hypothetical protein